MQKRAEEREAKQLVGARPEHGRGCCSIQKRAGVGMQSRDQEQRGREIITEGSKAGKDRAARRGSSGSEPGEQGMRRKQSGLDGAAAAGEERRAWVREAEQRLGEEKCETTTGEGRAAQMRPEWKGPEKAERRRRGQYREKKTGH